ncbi:ScbA/BarX family gamma-butyrolactone biosynthesis protein [Streptomyces angustmyceticus]|uniref:ScbA/BarX family gamma-butyrolactone biosynthesis protein n=1 Tax=Streptomyces angustmyceticus TaxID=285578 RepID=UPI0036D06E1A
MSTSTVGAAGKSEPLSWSRTVERELVHRTSVAEVLLTDVRPTGTAHVFRAAASWPRAHATFPRDGSQRHSPLILVETLRQLGLYVPLRHYAVPAAWHAVITDLYFRLSPADEPPARAGATEVTCRARVSAVRRRTDGTVAGLRLNATFAARGRTFGSGGGGVRFLDGARFSALRAGSAGGSSAARASGEGRRPSPARLTVNHPHDVVLALDGDGLLVSPADPRHPFFFDHLTDHVPGMVLLEAARQAASYRSGGTLSRPSSGWLQATRFTELAPPAHVLCTRHRSACAFRIVQDGAETAYGTLGYT